MPALITHQLFGEKMLQGTCKGMFGTKAERDAFLLGNQGPDPFFYHVATPQPTRMIALARSMHNKNTVAQFDAMRCFSEHMGPGRRDIGKAYVLGFICHFALDSTTHPFIFAQQDAICSAGVPGLDNSSHSEVHNQIESDLDAMMLWRIKATDIAGYAPHDEIFKSGPAELDTIDRIIRYTTASAQDTILPEGEYTRAVDDFKRIRRLLYSPTGAKRNALGRAERIFRKHSAAQSMSTPVGIYADCGAANSNHAAWKSPSTGVVSNASFLDLFDQALDMASEDVACAIAGKPSKDIARGVNFSGVPLP